MVRLGVERLLTDKTSVVEDQRLGLITNPSGTDGDLNTTIDQLHDSDAFDLRRLFGPEHGIRGDAQVGVKVEDSTDERTGLPVTSLYGRQRRLQPEMIEDLDAIVYDIQDIGCRFYTNIYTLGNALWSVAQVDKRLFVLDRPNPIAPLATAGNRIDEDAASFVGGYELPIIHGMTVGELASYMNEEFAIGADVSVVEMSDWSHSDWFSDTDLPWVSPSPNMPTVGTAMLYPGTCFFEGTNLSEGRGTTRPFELVGAPWISADEWAEVLAAQDLPGVAFRPAYFSPTFSKHEQQHIEGVQLHLLDRDAIAPVKTGLTMLASVFELYDQCDWIEYDDEFFVDKLAGESYLRETIDGNAGDDPRTVAETISDRWTEDRAEFDNDRARHLRY